MPGSRDQLDEYLYRPQGDPGHGGLSQRKNIHSSIAISYDSRINPRLFAEETAWVMAANGITAYLDEPADANAGIILRGPEIRKRQADAMITASHNPENARTRSALTAAGK